MLNAGPRQPSAPAVQAIREGSAKGVSGGAVAHLLARTTTLELVDSAVPRVRVLSHARKRSSAEVDPCFEL